MGNAMEWFDFGVYSYLAVVLGKVFFPNTGGSGLLYSLTAFAVAFVIRPIGGVLLGLLGDRIGRKRILTATIIMMAAAPSPSALSPATTPLASGRRSCFSRRGWCKVSLPAVSIAAPPPSSASRPRTGAEGCELFGGL
jgi:MFS family permease